MSAPTALDDGATRAGLVWHVRAPRLRETPHPGADRADGRRSADLVPQLTRTHDELCTQAVDSFEIAAGLEAAGLNDRQVRSKYAMASVFELADAMYRLVPRRPTNEHAPGDPWRRPIARHLLRGLLYGLPGLLYAVVLGTLAPGWSPIVLLGATVAACGLGQGLAVLGHIVTGRGEEKAAQLLFRSALVGGLALLGISTGAAWLAGALLPVAVLAGSQIVYQIAANILMVLERDVLLFMVLAPSLLFAAVHLAGVASAVPHGVVVGVVAGTLVAAVAAAGSCLTGRPLGAGMGLLSILDRGGAARMLCASYVGYGAITAGLVSFAVVDVLARPEAASGAVVFMMLPLVASLGVAEWLVYRLRSRAAGALCTTTSAAAFRSRARLELLQALLYYTVVVTGLTGTVIAWQQLPGPAEVLFVLGTCAYAVLGLAFVLLTMLLSLGQFRLATGLSAVALVVDTGLRWPLGQFQPMALDVMHLGVFTALVVVLIPVVAARYGSVGMHR